MDLQLKRRANFLLALAAMISISSCVFSSKVRNPKRPGSYPKETRKLMLLGAKSVYRDCYDVHHYSIRMTIDPAKKYIKGQVAISAKVSSPTDSIQIDLYENMKINSISMNGEALSYKRVEGAVFIRLQTVKKEGEYFTLDVNYEGKPEIARKPPWNGGFTWKKDKNGLPWTGVSCESEGASLWWPCKDEMMDEADSVDTYFTVPSGLMAVSNGNLVKSSISTGSSMYHWHISYPINNYNVTVYVGNFKLLQDQYTSAITGKVTALNHYVLPHNFEKASQHFQQVKKHLAFYEKTFGEYPWQRDGFKLVESPFDGMEHQSAIAYGNGYKNDYSIFDYIILHETAHEWWGNSVTAADLADAWIHEGFASYCEALFVESLLGKQEYLSYMGTQKIFIKNKRPVVRKRGIRYFDYHDEDIYVKGSWVLHTLRNTIKDDSLFFDILKTFRTENHMKQIYSETFVELVNKKTGKDYNWFFKQYLFRREAPIFEYYWAAEGLYYRWASTDTDFVMPITILVNNKSVVLKPSSKVQMIKLNSKDNSFFDNSHELLYGSKKKKELIKIYQKSRSVHNYI
jgi:aminopeptidase N